MAELQSTKDRRKRKRALVRQLKAEIGCLTCKERDVRCLDFHHLDPKGKVATIRQLLHDNTPLRTILVEIGKCELICANCHRKKDKTYQPKL